MDIEKLSYILYNCDFEICKLIENVVEDSEEDPHYSAVTATNLIKCYIQIKQDIGEKLDYNDTKGFILCHGYSMDFYKTFETHRKKEAEYYIGEQF